MCYLYVEKKKLPQKSGSFSVPSIYAAFRAFSLRRDIIMTLFFRASIEPGA
jgi:hypothetical protein